MEDYYMQRAEDDYIEQADIDSTMIVNEVAEQVVADEYVDDREQQVMAMDANRVYQGADDVAREDYLEEQVVGMDTGGYNQFVQRDDGFVDAGYPSVAEDIAVDAVANDFAQNQYGGDQMFVDGGNTFGLQQGMEDQIINDQIYQEEAVQDEIIQDQYVEQQYAQQEQYVEQDQYAQQEMAIQNVEETDMMLQGNNMQGQ